MVKSSLKNVATNVIEIHVNFARTSSPDLIVHVALLVINHCIEAGFVL